MWKKSEIFKKRKFQIVILVEVCMLLLGLVGILRGDATVYSQTPMDLSVDGEINFAEFALSPGSYEILISYETTEDRLNPVGVFAPDAPLYGLLTNEVYLSAMTDTCRFQFYSLDWLGEEDGLCVKIKNNGTQQLVIKGIEVVKTNDAYWAWSTAVVAISLLTNWLIMLYAYMGKYEVSIAQKLVWFGLPTAALVASAPVFVDYIVASGQVPFMVQRIELLADGLAGEFGLQDLFLLFPALLRMLGFPMIMAYSLFVVGINCATIFILYGLLKLIFRDKYIGILGAVLYTIAPYRLDVVYSQVEVGEYAGRILLALLISLVACVVAAWLNKRNDKHIRVVFFVALMLCSLFWSIRHTSDILDKEASMLRPHTIESFVDIDTMKH